MVARRHPRPPSLLAFRCVWMHAEAHCGEQRGWRMAAQAGGISQAPQNIDYRYAPIYRRYIAPNRDYAKSDLVRECCSLALQFALQCGKHEPIPFYSCWRSSSVARSSPPRSVSDEAAQIDCGGAGSRASMAGAKIKPRPSSSD